ncbi:MAG: sarcosine oxidase subunit delta [Caulobacterales bacterium]|nr:sarcosine oxidase subunit delta [Caulobacterales bacterium]
MLIPCPYCGQRLASEFAYMGDARLTKRPDYSDTDDLWTDYVYLRDNAAGPHRELWYHGFGCGAWLVVERDTVSHDIISAAPASTRP